MKKLLLYFSVLPACPHVYLQRKRYKIHSKVFGVWVLWLRSSNIAGCVRSLDDETFVKSDSSPVTIADLSVQAVMFEILNSHSEGQGVKIVAEEDFGA